MNDIIAEALLEMHFHSAIVEHFASTYGTNFLRLWKPSPRREAWVGFDQGWVSASIDTEELFKELKSAIDSESSQANHLYFGYFLQYKVVSQMSARSAYSPDGYVAPYLRAEVDLKPSKESGRSQYQTLLRLKNIANTSVAYACPMFFGLSEVFSPPDLSLLRCIPIRNMPTDWKSPERHFIAFTDKNAIPCWCSKPIPAEVFDFVEWASPENETAPRPLSAEQLRELITTASREIVGETSQLRLTQEPDPVTILPSSFTILEFRKPTDHDDE